MTLLHVGSPRMQDVLLVSLHWVRVSCPVGWLDSGLRGHASVVYTRHSAGKVDTNLVSFV